MARIHFILFALLAIGLAAWQAQSAPPAVTPPPATSRSIAVDASVVAQRQARAAWERAAALTALESEELASILLASSRRSDPPDAETAAALRVAADHALAGVPGDARRYSALALTTSRGAVAWFSGHPIRMAPGFGWVESASASGEGTSEEWEGERVRVFRAVRRSCEGERGTALGSLAIAFAVEPEGEATGVVAAEVSPPAPARQRQIALGILIGLAIVFVGVMPGGPLSKSEPDVTEDIDLGAVREALAAAGPASGPLPANVKADLPLELPPPAPTDGAAIAPSPASEAPSRSAALSADEMQVQRVYGEFIQVRARCGEPVDSLTLEVFRDRLRKNQDQLMAKHGCQSVRYQVYVKEGRAALRATPIMAGSVGGR